MTIPSEMDVALIDGAGGPEVLKPGRRPVPEPAAGEILVAVAAAGVNRPDVMQRMGMYPAPKDAPEWPGLEIAGTVVKAGEGAGKFSRATASWRWSRAAATPNMPAWTRPMPLPCPDR